VSECVWASELVCMALAAVAEDRQINDVLEALSAREGTEWHIRGVYLYIHEDEELCFFDILLHTEQKREIVIAHPPAHTRKPVITR
ncbi:hypothetical protein MIMGU_mgv1a0251232mg, partial [Erythranthe guttata]